MTEHIDKLKAARDHMVEERREVADGLSKPYDREKTPELRRRIVELQAVIEAIDRALSDEEELEPGSITDWSSELPFGDECT
jgi:hypothetical protein